MKYLLRGLQAPPKQSAWQLSILPCLLGVCYFLSVQPAFNSIGQMAFQLGSAALGGLAVTLAALLLPGGLRACALGLNGFFASMLTWALLAQWQAQKAAGSPGGWIYIFYYDRPMAVLAVAAAAVAPLLCLRLLLPRKHSSEELRRNFASAFRIAAVGFSALYLGLLFYGFFLVRLESTGYDLLAPNWVPFQMVQYYFVRMKEAPWEAYEDWTYFFGNLLVLFPAGFLLRGLLRQKTWVALLLPAAFSLLMELGQLVFHFGHCDVDDWILNTFGAALGVAAAWLLNALRKRLTHGEETSLF
ncbi:MAG: VanZ family protein [Oscillospiraceae bacterium]|jgi:glycopeptide antibiotics resistance protein|nr:VanZ family protein [Oscillospiraceae bacterium]